MKITEITNQRVSRVQGNKVTIDQGDGTELTVDTTKNKDVIATNSDGSVSVNTNTGNSSMNKPNKKPKVKVGQPVKPNQTT